VRAFLMIHQLPSEDEMDQALDALQRDSTVLGPSLSFSLVDPSASLLRGRRGPLAQGG